MRPSTSPWLALLVLAACGQSPEAPRWHVAGGHLRAPDGRAVVLQGVNVANVQKHAPYLDTTTAADWRRLRQDFGFDAVRFLMTWSAIEPERGRYDDVYLAQVRERLAWAEDAGLVVILDMHQDVYGEGFGFDGAPRWTCDEAHYAAFQPREPWFLNNTDPEVMACIDRFYGDAELRERFVAAWAHVAAVLGDAPAVIGFDPLNEPVWGSHAVTTYEADLLVPLYTDVVAAVRRAAPGWVAFIEPGASRNIGIATALTQLPFGDVVYAPHSYDASAESGDGFDPTHRVRIMDSVAALRAEADALGAALWIGEYGGSTAAPGIADYMDAEADAFGAVAASSMYWSYDRDGGYGFLDAEGAEKAVLVDALVRPYPERVAGDPLGWSWDPATRTFRFTYAPDGSSTLPTELVVPERCFPGGYVVDCGGCTVEKAPGVARLLTAPGGAMATVTLRPMP